MTLRSAAAREANTSYSRQTPSMPRTFGVHFQPLRTERPRRAERLSRPTWGWEKGHPSGDFASHELPPVHPRSTALDDALAGLPSGSASSLFRAAILFAVARKSPHGVFN
jgi:hypothetical protein